jgi:hypothetical protein
VDSTTALLACVGTAAFLWLALAIASLRINRSFRTLSPIPDLATHSPRVAIVVPARDEADAIEASVSSMLAQEGVDLRVVVVNDGSKDDTGAILDRLAAGDPRLEVIHDPVLPEGWLGKVNALHVGVQRTTEPWLLFADADIRFHPRAVVSGVALLRDEERDFLALLPRFQWVSLFENALAPAFMVALLQFGSTRLEDPAHPDEAMGSGSYGLVRRATYEAVGGHEPLRAEVIDDIELGRLIKARGFQVAFRLAPALLGIRMYRGNTAAFWGVSKNIVASMNGKVLPALAAMALITAILLAGPLAAIVGSSLGRADLALAGLGLYSLQYVSLLQMQNWHTFDKARLLAFPLFSVVGTACVLRGSWMQRRGAVAWKGREIQIH